MPGRLILCATPIGNLSDTTFRALEVLKEADTVCAEDTRVTGKLLAHFGISARLERCDDNVIASRTPALLERIEAGEIIVFVSDAGTPAVSDPGSYLVDAALDAGIEIEVVPGASAVLTALVASGLSSQGFYFGGFLPRKVGPMKRLLSSLAQLPATLIFYESPHRTGASLAVLAEMFPGRQAVLARELTKLHEEVIRKPVEELAAYVAGLSAPLKGEVVLLVGPPVEKETKSDSRAPEIVDRIRTLLAEGHSRSSVVKTVAQETGAPRNAVYDVVHEVSSNHTDE